MKRWKWKKNEKDYVNSFIDSTLQVSDVENFKCSVPLISPLLNNPSLRCSSGADHLFAHHLCYADPSINIYLSILFNLCLFRGVVPDNCLASVIIPIVKDKNKGSSRC